MGSSRSGDHRGWFRTIAEHYDLLGPDPRRAEKAAAFLDRLFRRRGNVREVLDVACGTFSIDIPLCRRGYRVVGRDLSPDMLSVARRNVRQANLVADLAQEDMRSLRLGQTFDAILCLGTAFNYLVAPGDIQKALNTFYRHLRPGGLLILDLTNFDAWIDNPRNASAEVDYRAPDGTRIAIFAFNDQDLRRSIHFARFLTVVHDRRGIGLRFDEAPLRVWKKTELARYLSRNEFRLLEWWGDLRVGAKYDPRRSSRLVCVAART